MSNQSSSRPAELDLLGVLAGSPSNSGRSVGNSHEGSPLSSPSKPQNDNKASSQDNLDDFAGIPPPPRNTSAGTALKSTYTQPRPRSRLFEEGGSSGSGYATRVTSVGSIFSGFQPVEQSPARKRWNVIRRFIKSAISDLQKQETREVDLLHGIRYLRKLNHPEGLVYACFDPLAKSYITLDGKAVRFFGEDGRLRDLEMPPTVSLFDRILPAHLPEAKLSLYIGWKYEHNVVQLLDDSLEKLSETAYQTPLYNLLYNEQSDEFVFLGEGNISIWRLRFGNRYLMPVRSLTSGVRDLEGHVRCELCSLETSAPRTEQRLFLAQLNGVMVYNLHTSTLVKEAFDMHFRDITAIQYISGYNILLTGSRDGAVKLWDDLLNLKLIFSGHSKAISSIALYPFSANFITSSRDGTMRVWSIESGEQTQQLEPDFPVRQIGTQLGRARIFTVTGFDSSLGDKVTPDEPAPASSSGDAAGRQAAAAAAAAREASGARHWLELYDVCELHSELTRTESLVRALALHRHPHTRSPRLCALLADNSVRLVCAHSGHVLSSCLSPSGRTFFDSATYIAHLGYIYCISNTGDIYHYSVLTNPAKLMNMFQSSQLDNRYLLLSGYEHIITQKPESPDLDDVPASEIPRKIAIGPLNRALLFGGDATGCLYSLDPDTCTARCCVQAHDGMRINAMSAFPSASMLFTAGADSAIKVWRIYPYATDEVIGPNLLTFFSNSPPQLVAALRTTVAAVFFESSSMLHSVVTYDLKSKRRYDHDVQEDHDGAVTAVSSCERLKLFATSGDEGTIRVWTSKNLLIRILHLRETISSLSFSSERGDLVLGIERNLHRILHSAYLPRWYQRKMGIMKFAPEAGEEPLPFDERLCAQLGEDELYRLKRARAALRVVDKKHEPMLILTDEDVKRAEVYKHIKQREEELGKLMRNELKPAERVPEHLGGEYKRVLKPLKDRVLENLLRKFGALPPMNLKEEDLKQAEEPKVKSGAPASGAVAEDEARKLASGSASARKSARGKTGKTQTQPELPTGFFPPGSFARTTFERLRAHHRTRVGSPTLSEFDELVNGVRERGALPSAVGELPNSALIGLLWPKEEKERFDEENKFVLPDWLQNLPPRKESVKPPPEEEFVDRERRWSTGSAEQSGLMQRLQDIVNEPAPEGEKTEPEAERTKTIPSASKKPPLPRLRSKGPSFLERKPIKRPVSEATEVKAEREPSRVSTSPPPPAREPSPPRPPTPLPDFIRKFCEHDWFKKHFPEPFETSVPKPWTPEGFFQQILQLIRDSTDFSERAKLIRCLQSLLMEFAIAPELRVESERVVLDCLLQSYPRDLANDDDSDLGFVLSCMRYLVELGSKRKEYLVEILVLLLEAPNEDVQNQLMDILTLLNVHDGHRLLLHELDSWSVWNIEVTDYQIRHKKLADMSQKFLETWYAKCTLYWQQKLERHSKFKSMGLVGAGGSPTRASTKRSFDTAGTSSDGHTEGAQRSVSTGSDEVDRVDVAKLTYIDALNFFLEFERRKAMKRAPEFGPIPDQLPEAQDNTVLMMPPEEKLYKPLIRLGETHVSHCRPHRETVLSTDYYREMLMTARGIRPAGGSQDEFPPCVRLPVHVAQFGRGVVASTADWDAWRTRVEQSEMFEHFVRQVRDRGSRGAGGGGFVLGPQAALKELDLAVDSLPSPWFRFGSASASRPATGTQGLAETLAALDPALDPRQLRPDVLLLLRRAPKYFLPPLSTAHAPQ